jgi:putative transposase
LKNERVDGARYETRDAARADIFKYIEVFYNRLRHHSSLNGVNPVSVYEAWLSEQSKLAQAA